MSVALIRVVPSWRWLISQHRLPESFCQGVHIPGVSVAVVHNGTIEWAKGYRVRQTGGDPLKTDTIFQAGSISAKAEIKRGTLWQSFESREEWYMIFRLISERHSHATRRHGWHGKT